VNINFASLKGIAINIAAKAAHEIIVFIFNACRFFAPIIGRASVSAGAYKNTDIKIGINIIATLKDDRPTPCNKYGAATNIIMLDIVHPVLVKAWIPKAVLLNTLNPIRTKNV